MTWEYCVSRSAHMDKLKLAFDKYISSFNLVDLFPLHNTLHWFKRLFHSWVRWNHSRVVLLSSMENALDSIILTRLWKNDHDNASYSRASCDELPLEPDKHNLATQSTKQNMFDVCSSRASKSSTADVRLFFFVLFNCNFDRLWCMTRFTRHEVMKPKSKDECWKIRQHLDDIRKALDGEVFTESS